MFSASMLFGVLALTFLAAGIWAVIYWATYAVRSQLLSATRWRGRTDTDSVALTFDDGPSPDTESLLNVLKIYNARATFFLIGQAAECYAPIAQRIVCEGHEIGNHSYSHPIYLYCGAHETRRELQQAQASIEKATGVRPLLARPPCGVRTRAYFKAARELGLTTVQWTCTGFDWKQRSAKQIAHSVLKDVNAGSIILLHDGDSTGKRHRRETVAALPLIFDGLRERGLHVAPLSQLLGVKPERKYAVSGKVHAYTIEETGKAIDEKTYS